VLLERLVVSREIEYRDVVSGAPVFVPSTRNCTKDTGLSWSVAVAVSVIVPETVALFAGAVTVTTGAVVSVVTVKLTPLLATPPAVTTTFPVVAPAGTDATMLVALQLVGVAVVALNFTVLVPCVAPKFAPAIVTDAPTSPDVGFKPVMLGPGTTLFTLTETPALVAVFPEVSVATAVKMWFPSEKVVVLSA